MSGGLERVLRERRERRRRVIEALRAYAGELRRALGRVTLILYGSYARGDFNAWSDVDVIVVSEAFKGVRYVERWRLLPPPPPGLEALDTVTWTPGEARVMLGKPSWRKALEHAVVVADDYGLLGEGAPEARH